MNAERIDHAAEARLWAENAVKAQAARNEQQNEQLATAYAAIGQVHATLELVEQQRIANLIAFYNVSPDDAGVLATAGVSFAEMIRQIREGLGI